jgi:tetratricopeptide (TPR) repeat protein
MVIPQLLALGLLIALSTALFWDSMGWFSGSLGAVLFLCYSQGSRWLLLTHHRQGMQLTKQGNFSGAIAAFEKSYVFFSKHPWLDYYRSLTMMTPVLQSYREMALINIAYCYAQLGDKQQTKAYYERTLKEFPNSGMAQSAMQFIHLIEQDTQLL